MVNFINLVSTGYGPLNHKSVSNVFLCEFPIILEIQSSYACLNYLKYVRSSIYAHNVIGQSIIEFNSNNDENHNSLVMHTTKRTSYPEKNVENI